MTPSGPPDSGTRRKQPDPEAPKEAINSPKPTQDIPGKTVPTPSLPPKRPRKITFKTKGAHVVKGRPYDLRPRGRGGTPTSHGSERTRAFETPIRSRADRAQARRERQDKN